jgi:hypothetical protein
MSKATTLTLVSDLAVAVSDATAAGSYYDDIVEEFGFSMEPETDAVFVAAVQGTASYALPTSAIRGLAFLYDDTQLYFAEQTELEAADDEWRSRQGTPAVVNFVDLAGRTFGLTPVPDRAGATVGVLTPFTGHPVDNVTVIYTNRVSDLHSWEELAMALAILAREMARDSEHKDTRSAGAWKSLADLFALLVF